VIRRGAKNCCSAAVSDGAYASDDEVRLAPCRLDYRASGAFTERKPDSERVGGGGVQRAMLLANALAQLQPSHIRAPAQPAQYRRSAVSCSVRYTARSRKAIAAATTAAEKAT
jgi:hypothetical protein